MSLHPGQKKRLLRQKRESERERAHRWPELHLCGNIAYKCISCFTMFKMIDAFTACIPPVARLMFCRLFSGLIYQMSK